MASSDDDVTQFDDRPRTPATGELPKAPVLGNRYEVLSLLGVGGMGAVYRVRDRELDEIVALKMLRRELIADAAMLERFRIEVKAARKVTSTHVARAFDIGEHEGDRFITMELVDGRSLADEIATNNGGMALARVKAIALDVCNGLDAAHSASVVHRDLKPDNVLIAKDGSAKITDFGIAKVEASARITHGSVGTPAYMAPEQVTGGEVIDARADLYALGVMLFEMITGDIPWKGETIFAVAAARLMHSPPDARTLRPGLPPALAELVLALMSRTKDARPASATAVAAALGAIDLDASADSAPASTRAPPRPQRSGATVVAVLPLANRGKSDDAYLAEAVTDDAIDALSMSRGVRVFARGAVAAFAGTTRDPREIGRELGADVVVYGSIDRAGDAVRVRARVIAVADGLQLRVVQFSLPIGDLLSGGGGIARAVAEAMHIDAAPQRQAVRDPSVVDLYVRARHEYFRGRVDALILFREALARTPDDPLILSGYALARLATPTTNDELLETAAIAARAVELAPELAEAHLASGHLALHRNLHDEAASALRRALVLAPSNGEAHFMVGRLLGDCAAFDDGIPHLEIARRIDPTHAGSVMDLARLHALLGDWERSSALLETIKHAPFSYWQLFIRFALWRGDTPAVEAAMATLRSEEIGEHPLVKSIIDFVDRGATAIGRSQGTPRRIVFGHQLAAEIRASRGLEDAALDQVERATAAGLVDLAWMTRCPVLVPFQDHPRFAEARRIVTSRAAEILQALR
jgi:serine/threonine-protein kinase